MINIWASFDKGSRWSKKVTINGSVTGNAGKVATSQIVADLNCTAGGAESMTVPAGAFDTVIATCTKNVIVSSIVQGKTTQLASNLENMTYGYAKSVGYVKSVATGGSNHETIVLTAYKIP